MFFVIFPGIILQNETEVWTRECQITKITDNYELSINCFYSGEEYTILSGRNDILYQYASGEVDTVQCTHYIIEPFNELDWRCE